MLSENNLLQFKITLQKTFPPVWRKIQISNDYTFWDLHVAIQDAMGWEDSHLHQFEVMNPKTSKREFMEIPGDDGDFDDYKILPGWHSKVRDYVVHTSASGSMHYLYDFGDHWEHIIKFEGEYPKQTGIKYPLCLAGSQACPPEDVGGVSGYENYVKIMRDPAHEEYLEMLEWRGKFDPEKFNPRKVKFDDPINA